MPVKIQEEVAIFDDFLTPHPSQHQNQPGREEIFSNPFSESPFSESPYKFTYQTYQHVRTRRQQLTTTAVVFIGYYLGAELLRRAFLYVVFGRNFLSLKNKPYH